METSELYFVETRSLLGRLIDPTPIVLASREENMLPLTHDAIESYELGVYVTKGIGKGAPVLGYVACKEIVSHGNISTEPTGLPEDIQGAVAIVGCLYLERLIRGRGIATQLVDHITGRIFQNHDEVVACLAQCNEASFGTFVRNDYQPMTKYQSLIPPARDKKPLLATRSRWLAHKTYQTMYNGGESWRA